MKTIEICPYLDGICGVHAQCKNCEIGLAYRTRPKYEIRSLNHDLIGRDYLDIAIRVAISNSIIAHHCDIESEISGEVVATFVDGLAIYIDASYYYSISEMLRKLYKREEV